MNDWPLRPVASLGEYVNGYPFKPDQHGSDGRLIVRIRQLNDPEADADFFDGHVPLRNHIDTGDLIFSWSGSLCVAVWDRGPAYLNQHLFKVLAGPGIDQVWLRWALDYAVELFEPFMHGSAMTHITKPMMRAVRVPVPPVEQQRAIGHFLDDQVGRVESASRLRRQQEQLLREAHVARSLKAGFGSSSITQKQAGSWHGTVSLTAGSAVDDTPPSWVRRRLKSVARRSDEVRGEREITLLSLASAGHLYPRDMDRQPPSDESLPRYLVVEPGDLVVNPMWLVGGAVAVSDKRGCVSPDYRVFKLSSDVEPRFLHHVLRTKPYIEQYKLYTRAETTFDRRVQQADLDNLPLSLPPIAEQRRVAEELDEQTRLVEQAEAALLKSKELLAERRRALITAALTGQLDPATMSDRAGKVAVA